MNGSGLLYFWITVIAISCFGLMLWTAYFTVLQVKDAVNYLKNRK